MQYGTSLPASEKLNIAALSRLFKSTTNSYKYLFFLSILEVLPQREVTAEGTVKIPMLELAAEMLVLSWYPIKFFNLSFGVQDQVTKLIDLLEFNPNNKAITSSLGEAQLREAIFEQGHKIGLAKLLKYVPYRLQSVFFNDQLNKVKDYKKGDLIAELSDQYFSTRAPLYRFTQLNGLPAIELNSDWVTYFLTEGNLPLVKGWALWEWASYLQARNPNVPAVIQKILPPMKRSALNNQTSFWKAIIAAEPDIRCIYTGESFQDKPFALDHFLPWSFVCHDQLWNLCPVTQSSNSSKSNKLPADEYIEKFIQQQQQALEVGSRILPFKKWEKAIEPYTLDLRIPADELLNESTFNHAFLSLLKPMMSLAEQTGFESNWHYIPESIQD